jgi:single-stranded-DNA-specific exonuclease
MLCAAGVTFLFLVALNRQLAGRGYFAERPKPNLMNFLHLVALATVADVAPLVGVNRALTRRGVELMNRLGGADANPWITALRAIADVGTVTATTIGYQFGPRLNASGRLGHPTLAAKLLTTQDPAEARAIAQLLDEYNNERRRIEASILDEALGQADALAAAGIGHSCIVVAGRDWNAGVVGIVAARLAEQFGRPAFALAIADGIAVGSGRSRGGVDLSELVRRAVGAGIAIKGGGHAAAAGITLEIARLPEFVHFAEETAAAIAPAQPEGPPTLVYDARLAPCGDYVDFARVAEEIEASGPWGAAAPEPLFVVENCRFSSLKVLGEAHLRFTASTPLVPGAALAAIAFRSANTPIQQLVACDRIAHVLCAIEINEFRGTRTPQLRVLDLMDAETPAVAAGWAAESHDLPF